MEKEGVLIGKINTMLKSNIVVLSAILGSWVSVAEASTDLEWVFRINWSRDQLSINTKTVHFWKILLAGTEKAY